MKDSCKVGDTLSGRQIYYGKDIWNYEEEK